MVRGGLLVVSNGRLHKGLLRYLISDTKVPQEEDAIHHQLSRKLKHNNYTTGISTPARHSRATRSSNGQLKHFLDTQQPKGERDLYIGMTAINSIFFSSLDGSHRKINKSFKTSQYGDCDCLLDHGALTNKSKEANNNFPMQRKATRILSLIFKSKPDLPSEQVTSAVHYLLELLRSDDDEVLTNVCCALSYCIGGIIQHHNNWDIYDQLVGLLRNESCSVITPVLKIVVGIVGRKESWYYKFNPADLGCLVTLLDNHNEDADMVTDNCSFMYDIVQRGNMEAVIVAGFIKKLINLIQTLRVGKSDPDRVEEIIYAVAATINIAIVSGNDAQIKYLVDISCIEVLCDFIASCCSETFMRDSLEKLECEAPSIDYACRIEKNIKSIHFSSSPRQVPFYFGEFLRKLDKYLRMS